MKFHLSGGGLPLDADSYVEREADQLLFNFLLAGEFCYVLNSRQMGKSSLLNRMLQRLKAEDVACARVDLQRLPRGGDDAAKWYAGFVNQLVMGFELSDRINWKNWWRSHDMLQPSQRLGSFLQEVLLTEIPDRSLVILIDEIDSSLGLKFDSDDFFRLMRACHQGGDETDSQRLTFGVVGVAKPAQLIRDQIGTPFNIGREISLRGFTFDEARRLAKGLVEKAAEPEAVLREVLKWTAGQPFLTQKLCGLVLNIEGAPILAGTEASWIEQLVQEHVIQDWEAQDEPEHFRSIENRLLRQKGALAGRMLGIYEQILMQGRLKASELAVEDRWELKLSGFLVERRGWFEVQNRIYREVFDQAWIKHCLGELRDPFYAEAFEAWERSGRSDESFLLRSKALDDALAWAKESRLNSNDEAFLEQCREVRDREKQELAARRERVKEEENQILADANRKATQRLKWGSFILAISLILAGGSWFFAAQQKELTKRAKFIEQAIEIQVEAREAKDQFEAGRQLFGLLKGIRTARAYQQFQPSFERLDEREKQEILKAKFLIQAALIKVYNIHERYIFHSHNEVFKAGFSSDSQILITHGDGGIVKLWNLDGSEHATISTNHQNRILGAQFSLESQMLVTHDSGRMVKLWNLDGSKHATLQTNQGALREATFSPDGEMLVTHSFGRVQLWDLNGREHRASDGHIRSINFSPDSKMFITHSDDGMVKLWNPGGSEHATLKTSQGDEISAIEFSPDSKMFITHGDDGTIKLWNLDGSEHATLQTNQSDGISAVEFSPDSQMLITYGQGDAVKMWNLDGSEHATLQTNQDDGIRSVEFSSDSQKLITIGEEKTLKVWEKLLESDEYEPIAQFSFLDEDISFAHFSHDGQMLFLYKRAGTVEQWNLEGTNQYYVTAIQPNARDFPILVSRDRPTLVTYLRNGLVSLWSFNQSEQTVIKPNQGSLAKVEISPDSEMLVTYGTFSYVKLWNFDGSELTHIPHYPGIGARGKLSPDGQMLVIFGGGDRVAKLRNLDGSEYATIQTSQERFDRIKFSPDSQMLLAYGYDGTITLWNLDGSKHDTLQTNQGALRGTTATFSPDSQMLLFYGNDGTITLWNLDGSKHATLQTNQGALRGATFSPDSQMLLSYGDDGMIKFWNLDGSQYFTLQTNQGLLSNIKFSPDGQILVTWNDVGTIKLWNLDGSQHSAISNNSNVQEVSFSPDGQILVISRDGTTVKLRNIDGSQYATFNIHAKVLDYVRLSPDGKTIITMQDDRVKLWAWDIDRLLDLSCDWVSDYLRNNPDVTNEDRALCGIPPRQ